MNSLPRKIIPYKRYFLDFYKEQSERVKDKIDWTMEMIRFTYRVPEKYFKHLEGTKGLYEIRVEYSSNIYRIFAFFDKENVIIIGKAFHKKTQKTPRQEIELALKIKEEYFYEKEKKGKL